MRGLNSPVRDAVIAAALNQGLDGIVADDPQVLSDLPPTVRRILFAANGVSASEADLVLIDADAVDPTTATDA